MTWEATFPPIAVSPAPEPIAFDTTVDTTTADVVLRPTYGY